MINVRMSKCSPVKNPCKYCLEQVTNKNGLQCQGACKNWAHFKCLQYTPGKISDIKAGIIKVICPCPDCEPAQEKEYLTKPPYTCSKKECPSNATGPVKCDADECPSNRNKVQEQKCSTKTCPEDTLDTPSQTQYTPPPKPCPDRLPSPQSSPIPKTRQLSRCASCGTLVDKGQKAVEMVSSSSTSTFEKRARPNQSSKEYSPEREQEQNLMANALYEMSGTVGMLSQQLKQLVHRINKIVENEVNHNKMSDKTE